MIAVGYVRVSTSEQAAGGLSTEAQCAAIRAACRRHGWSLVDIHSDTISGSTSYRPGLNAALARVSGEPTGTLVVAKLDRLARSLTAYAALLDRASREGWRLVALDTPETDTPQGEAMQAMTAVFAQLERRLISQRTKEALAAAQARGVRLGRPPALSFELRAEIMRLRSEDGLSATAIARRLERAGVEAPHGGRRWHTSTVTRALRAT